MTKLCALVLALALAPLAAGCASDAGAKPAPTTTSQKSALPEDAKDVCIATMTRARECTDDYIPALVDARAQADKPPGIAEKVKNDRDGIIAMAKEEWKTDSQDENIAAMCARTPGPNVTAEEIDAAKVCNAKTDCKEFVSCVTPHFAKHFGK